VIRIRGDRLVVLLGDRRLEMPAWLEPAMRRIAATPSFVLGDLADALPDRDARAVLVAGSCERDCSALYPERVLTRSERCSQASEARDEPMAGTASTVRSWLLLEDPGPWGRDALRDARLPERVGLELQRRCPPPASARS
jgi:hypothetical protein